MIIRNENLSGVNEIRVNKEHLKFYFGNIKLFNNHDGSIMGYYQGIPVIIDNSIQCCRLIEE